MTVNQVKKVISNFFKMHHISFEWGGESYRQMVMVEITLEQYLLLKAALNIIDIETRNHPSHTFPINHMEIIVAEIITRVVVVGFNYNSEDYAIDGYRGDG
jgi:hypothetical protein